jgi:hypothetical protein
MTIYKKKNSVLHYFTPRYFLSAIISLAILSCAASVSAAEYVYISDNLRVGVRKEPVSGVPPISVVFTGMRLEVHEKIDGYVKITTDKGVEGWIKDIYVTKKAPAIIQLNAFRVKYDKLKKELSQGSDTSAVLEKANLALNDQIDELKVERREWARERASLMASQYKKSSWFWVIEIIVLISVSFGAGVLWYKTHVMKRLGGLRV